MSISHTTKKVRVTVADCNPVLGMHKEFAFLPHKEEVCNNLIEAAMMAGKLIGSGKLVCIKPCFNEEENGQGFGRVWRSFNGEAFKEFRWEGDKPISNNSNQNLFHQDEEDDEPTVKLLPKSNRVLEMGDLK
jgi:hypothetical protein